MSSNPYIGDVQLFGGTYAPRGWMKCEGQVLPIASYNALFALIGTQYGGDGRVTFALPDLRTRAIVGVTTSMSTSPIAYTGGQRGGEASVSLDESELATHGHAADVQTSMSISAQTTAGSTQQATAGQMLAGSYSPTYNLNVGLYAPSSDDPGVPLGGVAAEAHGVAQATGGAGGHENMQPWIAMSYIIAVEGLWPPRP